MLHFFTMYCQGADEHLLCNIIRYPYRMCNYEWWSHKGSSYSLPSCDFDVNQTHRRRTIKKLYFTQLLFINHDWLSSLNVVELYVWVNEPFMTAWSHKPNMAQWGVASNGWKHNRGHPTYETPAWRNPMKCIQICVSLFISNFGVIVQWQWQWQVQWLVKCFCDVYASPIRTIYPLFYE